MHANVIGMFLPQPAHQAHVLLVVAAVDHRARRRGTGSALKKACVIMWNMPADDAAQADRGDHEAELRDRRVGEHAP